MARYLERLPAGAFRIIGQPMSAPPSRAWEPLDLEAQAALERAGVRRPITKRPGKPKA